MMEYERAIYQQIYDLASNLPITTYALHLRHLTATVLGIPRVEVPREELVLGEWYLMAIPGHGGDPLETLWHHVVPETRFSAATRFYQIPRALGGQSP
jgi:hypothetical protein